MRRIGRPRSLSRTPLRPARPGGEGPHPPRPRGILWGGLAGVPRPLPGPESHGSASPGGWTLPCSDPRPASPSSTTPSADGGASPAVVRRCRHRAKVDLEKPPGVRVDVVLGEDERPESRGSGARRGPPTLELVEGRADGGRTRPRRGGPRGPPRSAPGSPPLRSRSPAVRESRLPPARIRDPRCTRGGRARPQPTCSERPRRGVGGRDTGGSPPSAHPRRRSPSPGRRRRGRRGTGRLAARIASTSSRTPLAASRLPTKRTMTRSSTRSSAARATSRGSASAARER